MAKEKKKRLGLKITLGVVITIILVLLGSLIFVEYSIKDKESEINQKQVEVEEAFDVRSVEVKDFIELLNSKMSVIPEKLTKLEIAIAKLEAAEKALENASGVKELSDASVKVDLAINNIIDTINNEYDFLKSTIPKAPVEDVETARHRIVISITNHNEAVDEYNNLIQGFPGGFIANIFGHEEKESFLSYEYEDIDDFIEDLI